MFCNMIQPHQKDAHKKTMCLAHAVIRVTPNNLLGEVK